MVVSKKREEEEEEEEEESKEPDGKVPDRLRNGELACNPHCAYRRQSKAS